MVIVWLDGWSSKDNTEHTYWVRMILTQEDIPGQGFASGKGGLIKWKMFILRL